MNLFVYQAKIRWHNQKKGEEGKGKDKINKSEKPERTIKKKMKFFVKLNKITYQKFIFRITLYDFMFFIPEISPFLSIHTIKNV